MRRPFVTTTLALALALAPAALFAQDPPPVQDPPAQPEKPPVRVEITGEAGVLIFPIKPEETTTFEQLIAKVKDGLAKSEDPVRQRQAASFKVFRADVKMGENVLFVAIMDPAVPAAEYDPLVLAAEAMGEEYATPEGEALMKRFTGVFGAGVSRWNLTPVGGGM
jgi:hypothetical protein